MLLRCIRAENRKLRGSAIWLVFFVVPLISCLYGTVNFLGNQGMLSFTWYDLWTQHTLFYALFFFAPMVGVYAAYLWRLEHLGRNWNLIMSAPVRPLYLFAAKALALIKLVAFTQGWVFLLFLLCGRLWARITLGGRWRRSATQPFFHSSASRLFHSPAAKSPASELKK